MQDTLCVALGYDEAADVNAAACKRTRIFYNGIKEIIQEMTEEKRQSLQAWFDGVKVGKQPPDTLNTVVEEQAPFPPLGTVLDTSEAIRRSGATNDTDYAIWLLGEFYRLGNHRYDVKKVNEAIAEMAKKREANPRGW